MCCVNICICMPVWSVDRYRWIDYQRVDPETEASHIAQTVAVHEQLLGHHPSGIYQGKPNERTRQLICAEGGFLYDCDSYADELPYWNHDYGRPHLGAALHCCTALLHCLLYVWTGVERM